MKRLRHIQLGLILMFVQQLSASTIYYPWTLKLDNGIKIKSVAYRTYDNNEPGKTWVYKANQVLYTVDKYLTGYVLTNSNGEFLIEINFIIDRGLYYGISKDSEGNLIQNQSFKGEAIKVFKKGTLIHKFDFSDLHIDTAKLAGDYSKFYWGTKNKEIKSNRAFVLGDTLHIIAIDNQEIRICLSDTLITPNILTDKRVSEILKIKTQRKESIIIKKLPEKFYLPQLSNGKSLESELAHYLKSSLAKNEQDSALIEIYVHTLLIDKNGVCTECYVSPSIRESIINDFGYYYDIKLKEKIEKWLKSQKYQIGKIPKYSDKYGFSDFIYLK